MEERLLPSSELCPTLSGGQFPAVSSRTLSAGGRRKGTGTTTCPVQPARGCTCDVSVEPNNVMGVGLSRPFLEIRKMKNRERKHTGLRH